MMIKLGLLLVIAFACLVQANKVEDTVLRTLLEALLMKKSEGLNTNNVERPLFGMEANNVERDTWMEPAVMQWKIDFQTRWNSENAAAMAERFTDDSIYIHSTGIYHGKEGVKEVHQLMFDEEKEMVEGEVMRSTDTGSLGPKYDYAIAVNHYFYNNGTFYGNAIILGVEEKMDDGTFKTFLKMELDLP